MLELNCFFYLSIFYQQTVSSLHHDMIPIPSARTGSFIGNRCEPRLPHEWNKSHSTPSNPHPASNHTATGIRPSSTQLSPRHPYSSFINIPHSRLHNSYPFHHVNIYNSPPSFPSIFTASFPAHLRIRSGPSEIRQPISKASLES